MTGNNWVDLLVVIGIALIVSKVVNIFLTKRALTSDDKIAEAYKKYDDLKEAARKNRTRGI